jgi:hypothetical protein
MSPLSRLRERARVRVRFIGATLISDPLPPKPGEEVIGSPFAQRDPRKNFPIPASSFILTLVSVE